MKISPYVCLGSRLVILTATVLMASAPVHAGAALARKVTFATGTIDSGSLFPDRSQSGGVGYELTAAWDGSPGNVDALIRYDNNGIETANVELFTDADSDSSGVLGIPDVPGRFNAAYVHNSGYADLGLFNFSDLSAVFSKRLSLTAPAAEASLIGFPNNTIGVMQNVGSSIMVTLLNRTNGDLVFERTYSSSAFVASSGFLDSQLANLIMLPDESGYVLLVSSSEATLSGSGLTYHNSFVIAYLDNDGAVLATTRLQATADGILYVPPQCQHVLSDNSILINILELNFDPQSGNPPVNHLFNIRSNGTLKWSKTYTGAILNGEMENPASGNVYFSGYRDTSTGSTTTADTVFARISASDGSLLHQANVSFGDAFPIGVIVGFNANALFAEVLHPGGGAGTSRITLLKMGLDLSAITTAVEYDRDVDFGILTHDSANAELVFSTFETSSAIGAITLTENFVPTATIGCSLLAPVSLTVTSPGITVANEPIAPEAVTVTSVSSVPVTTAASFSLSRTMSTTEDICTLPAVAPVISSALTVSGASGVPFTYTITASNNPTSYNATGLPAGLTVNTSTGAITGTPTTIAVTNVTISATNGTGTDQATLEITITVPPPVPDQPSAPTGGPTAYDALAAQWAAVAGATSYRMDIATDSAFTAFVTGYQDLDLGNVTSRTITGLRLGTYYVRIRAVNAGGSSLSSATLSVSVGSRLLNLSTRGQTSPTNPMIVGFFVSGEPKTLLIRVAAKILADLGVPGTLPNPRLRLVNGANVDIASNDDWDATDPAVIAAVAGSGAGLQFTPGSVDSVIVASNLPAGGYTAVVESVTGASGVVLVELYEIDTTGRLINISTRGFTTDAGANVMIPGTFIGPTSKRLLIRVAGETLGQFLAGTITDPILEIYDGDNPATPLITNDDWDSTNAALAATWTAGNPQQVAGLSFASGSKDAAVLVVLPKNNQGYTVLAKGKTGVSGTVLVEVYEVP